MDTYGHLPVMPEKVLELLAAQSGDTAVDGTLGLGGHGRLVCGCLGSKGRFFGFDQDAEALVMARVALSGMECAVELVNRNFETMGMELKKRGVEQVHRVFLDLGVSSLQLDKPERGFSFMRDGPLDMRMDTSAPVTAWNLVNEWPEERLAGLFKALGEERFSRRLAKSIVETRSVRPIDTTGELSNLAERVVPFRGRIHPATRMFQALRMEVNDELGTLAKGLAAAGKLLAPRGRLAVLTFHSLEDRLVKRTFLRWREMGLAALVNSRAESCGREEAKRNRRARSAKLRVVERL